MPTPKSWRPIKQSDAYLVSRDGRIWSVPSNRELKTKLSKVGYVNINLNYGVGTQYVHHLVAEAWICPRPSKDHVIDHIDGNKQNNCVSNLEWVSRKENAQRAYKTGAIDVASLGKQNRALTPEEVYKARVLRSNGESFSSIAKALSRSQATVRNAVYGISYSDLVDVPPLPLPREPGTWRPSAGGKTHEGPADIAEGHPSSFIAALPNENWKRLEGNISGYWVSDMGRVFSSKRKRLKKPTRNTAKQPYLRVQFRTNDNSYISHMLHRLVAECFLPPPPSPDHIVGHMNENPQDARATNLCWITRKENAARAYRFQQKGSVVSELHDFISMHIDVKHDVEIDGDSIDIMVPEKSIGFCYEDIALSSERSGFGSRDRVRKQERLAEKGIKLFFLFSSEWIAKREIIQSMIKSKLGVTSTRIGARKTKVKEVPTKEATAFLNENHIQGAVGARFKYGCYMGDELLALATFGLTRYGKSEDNKYELLRYAVKRGVSLSGGFSRLLKHFIKAHKPEEIVSYADRRWSLGSVYETNGFKLLHKASPNYFYFKPDAPNDLKSRILFQKHRLPKVLETFSPARTEFENMVDNGWDRIWDCGNLVYSREIKSLSVEPCVA